ncbi:MAG TPA: methyl-accepting chemotaxis protein [Burkholderiaceae bacterium]|nr:methyl-accepting chemotaxis protein [Burkholderiaceae bacterium]
MQKVDAGGLQVAEAGQTMSEIVQQVSRVCDLIAEISAAADEQSSGIAQVNRSGRWTR